MDSAEKKMAEKPTVVKESTITLGGFRHYMIDAVPEQPTTKTVFLAHGFSSSLEIFYKVIPLLAARYRVIGIDFLGFGNSEKPFGAHYSLEKYSAAIHEFLTLMRRSPQEEFFGIGHSMGGKYLAAHSVFYPEDFKKNILSNTDGFIYIPPVIRLASAPVIKTLVYKLIAMPCFVRKTMRSVYYDPSHITDIHFRRNLAMIQNRQNYDAMMELNRNYKYLDLKRVGIRAKLSSVKTPTLILWGENDRFISPKYARVAHAEIPGSELVFIPQCGHVPMVEKSERFVELVSAFIDRV
jgi:pimeloyl-ACP methyl ester carboxylesterase